MEALQDQAFEYFGAYALAMAFLMVALAITFRQWMAERAKNDKLQDERHSDLKVSLESLHKSIHLLDEARTEMHRRVG